MGVALSILIFLLVLFSFICVRFWGYSDAEEDDRCFRSGFFIEYEGFEWFIRMRNGEVTRIKRLWEIEEI